MQDESIISFKNVSKSYRLYTSPRLMAIDLLGIPGFKKRLDKCPTFEALKGVNIEIKRGARIGLVGRNGAGKTTLLKLITKNYPATSGTVRVDGKIQSLMDAGLGFHPEFTGYQNIRASLLYNGLPESEYQSAVDDIVSFVELGDFLHQPIKTYSLGMATRLGFATATAVRPEILIIDEVLSAGDAYFASKSAERIKRLTSAGATLILVSHSTAQILQYCEQVIWLDQGKVVAQGDALEIVKAYEAYIKDLESARIKEVNDRQLAAKESLNRRTAAASGQAVADSDERLTANQMSTLVLSRWQGDGDLKIERVSIFDSGGESYILKTGSPAEFRMQLSSSAEGLFKAKYHFNILKVDGTNVANHLSEEDTFQLNPGDEKTVSLVFKNLLLGPGTYVMSVGVYKTFDVDHPSEAVRYDLIDRSFEFKVTSDLDFNQGVVYHPCKWLIDGVREVEDVNSRVIGSSR